MTFEKKSTLSERSGSSLSMIRQTVFFSFTVLDVHVTGHFSHEGFENIPRVPQDRHETHVLIFDFANKLFDKSRKKNLI